MVVKENPDRKKNVLQSPFVEVLISKRVSERVYVFRMVKGYTWRFNTNFWQLGYRMYCDTEYIAAGFDALRSAIRRGANGATF